MSVVTKESNPELYNALFPEDEIKEILDKLNNNVDNLEWCSYSHNNRHARKTGLNKGNKGISYKNRCLKAIEYIEEHIKYEHDGYNFYSYHLYNFNKDDLLNLLQGKSDE